MDDTLDKLVIFLAKRDGIDKLVKTFQYVSKLVHWHVEKSHPDAAMRAKQWEVSSGLSRKAFRTGRFLTGFNAVRRNPGSTKTFRLLAVLSNAGEMVYFFFDHFLWLSRVGVLDAKLARRMSFISAFDLWGKMAEEVNHPSKYVKLKKDQGPMEEINPGELNQPIDVPQLHVRKCNECGQTLPESYQAPADEPWTTGIFDCANDTESCWTGLFCPCVLFGRNVEQIRDDTPWNGPCICHAIFVEGGLALAATTAALHGMMDPRTVFLIGESLVFGWWMCGIYTGLFRQSVQKKYHLKNSPCDPCLVHCCMHCCALCQEHREMKGRLSDDALVPMTVVNPPPVQEMDAATSHSHNDSASPSKNGDDDQVKVEMQPL